MNIYTDIKWDMKELFDIEFNLFFKKLVRLKCLWSGNVSELPYHPTFHVLCKFPFSWCPSLTTRELNLTTSSSHFPSSFCKQCFSLGLSLKCWNFNLNHSSSARLLSSNTESTICLFYVFFHSNFLLIASPCIIIFFVYISTSAI